MQKAVLYLKSRLWQRGIATLNIFTMRDRDTISEAGSLHAQNSPPEISIPIGNDNQQGLQNGSSDAYPSDELNKERSFMNLWSSFKGRSHALFVRDVEPANQSGYPRVSPRFSSSPKSLFHFHQGKSPSYLQMDGGEMVVRSFKEREDGTLIGLMENGSLMVSSRGPSRPSSGVLQVGPILP